MERIKFEIEIPKAVALTNGSGFFGKTLYEPTDEWLASLTPEARTRLGELLVANNGTRLSDYNKTFPVELTAPISADSVREALYAALLAADVAKAEHDNMRERCRLADAKRAAERAERVATFLKLGYDDLFDEYGQIKNGAKLFYWDELRVDREIDCPETRAHAKPFFARALVRRSEVAAAKEAAANAAMAQANKLYESLECDLRAWAVSCDLLPSNIRRAASEGRNIQEAVTQLAVKSLDDYLDSIFSHGIVCGWRHDTFGDEPRTDVPSQNAYDLVDHLSKLIKSGAVESVVFGLPNVVVEVGPISRFDISARGAPVWRTGVAVRVTHPWLRDPRDPKDTDYFESVVLAEPPKSEDDEDDGE